MCFSVIFRVIGPNQEFVFLTYNETLVRITHVASGLRKVGLNPKDFVGVYLPNCMEFFITQHACNTQSMACVPLYETLGSEAMEHILNQAQLSVVICSGKKLGTLVNPDYKLECLRTVILLGEASEEDKAKAADRKIEIFTFEAVEKMGEETPVDDTPPNPDDIAVVCYTSGTTGKPKGAMLSHGNLTAELSGLRFVTEDMFPPGTEKVHLSFLPMAHILEQIVQAWCYSHGGTMGFFRGDVKLLLDDVQALRPTLFVAVPRLLNRMYDTIMNTVNSSGKVKRAIFNKAMKSKKAALAKGVIRRDTIWDKLVFKKIQMRLGGRVRAVATGAAPIADHVLTFARCAFGCPVTQGYGQSECCGAATSSLKGDSDPGHVGIPLACSRIKLMPVPEMNYVEENNEGEVCIKGANVFKGYLNDKVKTEEAIDGEGWLHTGDIGRWNANGTLSIIDRKKDIFKLAQGEYVAPEKVEMSYGRAPLVGQVFVHGDSLQSACVGVIVPDETTAPQWAREHGASTDLAELCQNDEFRAAVFAEVTAAGKDGGLKSFEQVKAIHLHPEPFTAENGLVTPTFKLKRPQLRGKFGEQISDMYKSLGEAAPK